MVILRQKESTRVIFCRIAFLVTLTTALFSCIEKRIVPENPALDDPIDIMPYTTGFTSNENTGIEIQGGWYWYQNLGSNVKEFKGTSKDGCEYHWYNAVKNGNVNSECYKGIDKPKEIVETVCIKGNLATVDETEIEEEDKGPYLAIGFELCSSSEDSKNLYQFPYTLGSCPFGGNDNILETFLGISFSLLLSDDEKLREDVDYYVRFKERHATDSDPSCSFNTKNLEFPSSEKGQCSIKKNDVENGYIIEAKIGNADKQVNIRNLQAIHIEAMAPKKETIDVSFCVSALKAIRTSEPREGWEPNTERYVDASVPDLEEPEQVNITGIEWINAKDTDESDAGVSDYPDNKPFQIMQKEVTIGQYYQFCETQDSCLSSLRNWDSCNVYRYHFFKVREEEDNCKTPSAEHAANCINWVDARRFCQAVGGDLPTETQWNYAAKAGHEKYKYSWENDFPDCDYAYIHEFQRGGDGCGDEYIPNEGCIKEKGNTATGVCDMIGNLWEWVLDNYLDDCPDDETENWLIDYKKIKGGSFNTEHFALELDKSTSAEHPLDPHSPTRVGFRCVRDTPVEDGESDD